MNDLTAISLKWLNQCPRCDADLPYGCTCCPEDPRSVIFELWKEVTELRAICRYVRQVSERDPHPSQTVRDILRIVEPRYCGVDGTPKTD